MSEMVAAYQRWLGIPAEDSASGGPNHYRLLGLKAFESDRPTIDAAAKRLIGNLQPHLAGPNQATVRKLLDEISEARRCLMLNDRKVAYDQSLRASLEAKRQADVPVPFEAVPEAEPLPLDDAVPKPELIDGMDDAPEATPYDEIEDPTALEQIAEPRSAPQSESAIQLANWLDANRLADPESSLETLQKSTDPQTVRSERKPTVYKLAAQSKPASKPAPQQASIAPAAGSSPPATEDSRAADTSGWADPVAPKDAGASGSWFFSGLGLSGRAGGTQQSRAYTGSDSTGIDPTAKPSGKPSAFRNQAGGRSTVKKTPRRGPETWQIVVGVGSGVVLLILAIVLFNGSSPSAVETQRHQETVAESDPPRIEFGPHTVVGRIHDRTVLSPVTGASANVPIERHGDLFLADVKINDREVGKFLLDTGTSNLIISNEVADKLNLPRRQSKNLKTPGGMQEATQRKIDSLKMGPVRFEEAMILPEPTNDEWLALGVDIKPWADAIHLPIAGVIGGEIWSQVPFSIDPANRVVTFYKRGPFPFSAGETTEFLTRFDNFLKPAMPAVIDSGPEGTFLLATGAPGDVMVKGSSAPVKILTVLGQEIPNPATVESKDGDGYFDADVRQSGVIGAGILSHYLLMFDYAGEKFMAVRIKK